MTLVEERTFLALHGSTTICHLDTCDHVGKIIGDFKLEPIGNVPAEISRSLGLSNWRSMEDAYVELVGPCLKQKLPIQGCHGTHIFDTYLPGSKVPLWFCINNLGSSVNFIVPSNLNSRVRGLSICSVYELSGNPLYSDNGGHIVVSNKTKGLIWSYSPWVFGVGEDGQDKMWLSYWKFEKKLLEAGDELNVFCG